MAIRRTTPIQPLAHSQIQSLVGVRAPQISAHTVSIKSMLPMTGVDVARQEILTERFPVHLPVQRPIAEPRLSMEKNGSALNTAQLKVAKVQFFFNA